MPLRQEDTTATRVGVSGANLTVVLAPDQSDEFVQIYDIHCGNLELTSFDVGDEVRLRVNDGTEDIFSHALDQAAVNEQILISPRKSIKSSVAGRTLTIDFEIAGATVPVLGTDAFMYVNHNV